jgi:hypothetical protein
MTGDRPIIPDYLDKLIDTHMINNPDIARTLGELLISNHYSESHMELQKPFQVEDQGDQWVVRGNRNKDHAVDGLGPAKIVIRKKDGQILEMHIPYIMHPHPDVKPLLDRARKAKS